MRTGTIISAAGHGLVIAVAVWGLPWLKPRDRDPIPVAEVSFVTEAEFEAAMAAASSDADRPDRAPQVVLPAETAEAPEPPEIAEAATPELEPDVAPEDPAQDVATLVPEFNPETPLATPAPDLSSVPAETATPSRPAAVVAPRSRPAVRIEPSPTPTPPEPSAPAETFRQAAAPTPEAAEPVPEALSEAPPEAAPEPVAQPTAPEPLAVSRRPMPRQLNVAAPASTAVSTAADAPADSEAARVMAALRAEVARETERRREEERTRAAGATPATEPARSTPPTPAGGETASPGPPITSAERDGLKFAIQRCWNVPAGLREAEELKIVIAAELTAEGDLVGSSVRMIEPANAPDSRYQVAYDAARRALIRCSPYTDLPREKFEQWRNIEVVFNPEGMVSW